jgi:RES domain
VRLYRCFAWNASVRHDATDGPLWFPTIYQGDGRHDNPDAYGCLYLSDRPVSCVIEQLAAFRGQRLSASLLRRRGLPLALADIDLADDAVVLDLDNPSTLRREKLRPSNVATRHREVTQPQALDLYRRHRDAAGLRWWSTFEALWINVTLFERASAALRLVDVRPLTLDDPVIVEAADAFGLRVV